MNTTRANSALDRLTLWQVYVSGNQRQVFKQGRLLSERSKKIKKTRKSTKRASCCRISLQFTKITIWPDDEKIPKKTKGFSCNFDVLLLHTNFSPEDVNHFQDTRYFLFCNFMTG